MLANYGEFNMPTDILGASIPNQQYITGLNLVPVSNKGDCLYEAVALSLGHTDVSIFREVVAAHLEHNIARYREFIVLPDGKTIEDYINDIRTTNEWATDLEISILSRLLDRPIVTVGQDNKITNSHMLDQKRQGEPIFIYHNINHYDALVLQGKDSGREVLARLLQKPDIFTMSSKDKNINNHEIGPLAELHKALTRICEQQNFNQQDFKEDFDRFAVRKININDNILWQLDQNEEGCPTEQHNGKLVYMSIADGDWYDEDNNKCEEGGVGANVEKDRRFKNATENFLAVPLSANSIKIEPMVYGLCAAPLAINPLLGMNYTFNDQQCCFYANLINTRILTKREDENRTIWEIEVVCNINTLSVLLNNTAPITDKFFEVKLTATLTVDNDMNSEVNIKVEVNPVNSKIKYRGGLIDGVNICSYPHDTANFQCIDNNFAKGLRALNEHFRDTIDHLKEQPSVIEIVDFSINIFGNTVKNVLLNMLSKSNFNVAVPILEHETVDANLSQYSLILNNKIKEILDKEEVKQFLEEVHFKLTMNFLQLSNVQIANLIKIFINQTSVQIIKEQLMSDSDTLKVRKYFAKNRSWDKRFKWRIMKYVILTSINMIISAINYSRTGNKIFTISVPPQISDSDKTNIIDALDDYLLNHVSYIDNEGFGKLFIYASIIERCQDLKLKLNYFDGSQHNHQIHNEEAEILNADPGSSIQKRRSGCFSCRNYPYEEVARLWERNPGVKGFIDGYATYFATRQLLSLYPDVRAKILPYLVGVNFITGTIGFGIGAYEIFHHKRVENNFIRVWDAAISKGLCIGIFGLTVAIEAYLSTHSKDDNKYVSEKVFFGQIVPIPIVLAFANGLWNSMSYNKKKNFFVKHHLHINIMKTLDILSTFLFYAGVIELSVLNITKKMQQNINFDHQLIPIATAGMLSLIHLTGYKDRFNTVMTYLTMGNFIYLLSDTEYTGELPKSLVDIQIAIWSAAMVISTIFTIYHSLYFVTKYTGTPNITLRSRNATNNTDMDSSMQILDPDTVARLSMAGELGDLQGLAETIDSIINPPSVNEHSSLRFSTYNHERYDKLWSDLESNLENNTDQPTRPKRKFGCFIM